MKTAYVTGGTGCVGRNLIDQLLREDWRVIAAHRRSSRMSRLAGLDIALREVDLHDPVAVRNSIPSGTDAVFHVAASVSHWPVDAAEQWKDNVLATRNLVRAAVQQKVRRFVFTSTGATMPSAGCDAAEAARIPCQYTRTKRQSELEIEAGITQGLDAVILKPGIIVGAYDYNNYSQIFRHLNRSSIAVVLPGSIEFCHARDVARAHITAFERGRSGESYLLGGHLASWLQLYQRIAGLLGVDPPQRQTPLWMLHVVSYPMLWISYVTRRRPPLTPQLVHLLKPGGATAATERQKAHDELGYTSSSIDEMLADCHRWMISEGMLAPPARPSTGAHGIPADNAQGT